jgi:hypothetical protein
MLITIFAIVTVVCFAWMVKPWYERRGQISPPGIPSKLGKNPHGDFPATKFGTEDLPPRRNLVPPKTPEPLRPARPLEHVAARPLLPAIPQPVAKTTGAVGEKIEKEAMEILIAIALGKNHDVSPNARTETQKQFGSEETFFYSRSHHDAVNFGGAKREGTALNNTAIARLVCVSGEHRGKDYAVQERGLVMGRHPACDLVLSDPRVSQRHAWLRITNGKAILRDLQSTNGTYVNAQPARLTHETELRSGDTIIFGGHAGDQFRFVVG